MDNLKLHFEDFDGPEIVGALQITIDFEIGKLLILNVTIAKKKQLEKRTRSEIEEIHLKSLKSLLRFQSNRTSSNKSCARPEKCGIAWQIGSSINWIYSRVIKANYESYDQSINV